jgi:hypothetical protein
MRFNPLLALSALTLAATCAACGGDTSLEARSRAALPTKDTVSVANPQTSAQALRAGGSTSAFTTDQQDSTVGDASSWYTTTYHMGTSVNGAVVWTLTLIKTVTDLPPTTCAIDTCTWGPGSGALDPADWKVVVTYDAEKDQYGYSLLGRAKAGGDGQFHSVVAGLAKPSALPHRGSGSFQVDFDASKLLGSKSTDEGQLQVNYSNAVPSQGHIDALFLGVKDGDPKHEGQKLNAAYGYDEDVSGGGSLEIAFRNLTSSDKVALHSRWKATGAGRADVNVFIHGDAGATFSAGLSECWGAPPFKVTWFTSTDPKDLGPDSGNAADCAFSDVKPASRTAP